MSERVLTVLGYVRISGKYEHIEVAERALGKPLPGGAQVHHVNEIKTDNRGCNLVICPSRAYHILLHYRTKAYDACGHADWCKCTYCKQYDDPNNLTRREPYGARNRGVRYLHKACHAAAQTARTLKYRCANVVIRDRMGEGRADTPLVVM